MRQDFIYSHNTITYPGVKLTTTRNYLLQVIHREKTGDLDMTDGRKYTCRKEYSLAECALMALTRKRDIIRKSRFDWTLLNVFLILFYKEYVLFTMKKNTNS